MHDHASPSTSLAAHPDSRPYTVWIVAAVMLVVIVGFYALREHWGHALGLAPYLLLLACPLMHVFMHGGHGHGHTAGDKEKPR